MIGSSLLLVSVLSFAHAQSDAPKTSAPKTPIGKVDITFDQALYDPSLTHLIGHAKITSDNYDLYAADIKVFTAPRSKSGAAGIGKAVAEGGATPGSQVVAHVRRPLQSESFEITSDRAVYQPDASRPGGGEVKFTGRVKVVTKSGFFAEPSLSTFDTATFLLGTGPDYPKLETGAGHITLTPAQ